MLDTRGNLRHSQGESLLDPHEASSNAKPVMEMPIVHTSTAMLKGCPFHASSLLTTKTTLKKNPLITLRLHTCSYLHAMRTISPLHCPSASPSYGTKLQMSSFNYLNNDLGSKIFPSLPQIFISSEINITMCLLPTAGKLWSDWNDIILFSYGISVLWDFREKLCSGLRWGGRQRCGEVGKQKNVKLS